MEVEPVALGVNLEHIDRHRELPPERCRHKVQLLAGLHSAFGLDGHEGGVGPVVKALWPGHQLPDPFDGSLHEGGRADAQAHGVSLTEGRWSCSTVGLPTSPSPSSTTLLTFSSASPAPLA